MADGDVTLRDHIERVIDERDKRYATERTAIDMALKLQALEMERRLTDLNHAHANAREALGTYVAKSVYERDQAAFQELKDEFNTWKAGKEGTFKGVSLLFSLGSAAALMISVSTALYVVATK